VPGAAVPGARAAYRCGTTGIAARDDRLMITLLPEAPEGRGRSPG
jgi:hypothetical protein